MGNSNKRNHLLLLYKNIIENLPFIDEKGEKKKLANTFKSMVWNQSGIRGTVFDSLKRNVEFLNN